MLNHPTHKRSLRQELRKRLIRYVLFQGYGGRLLLLWVVGMAIFLLALGDPFYAIIWTSLALLLGLWMTWSDHRNHQVWESLLHSVMDGEFPRGSLTDGSLRMVVQKGVDAFVGMALKVHAMGRAREPRLDSRRLLAAAYGLLNLQYQLAQKAEELERGLALINDSDRLGGANLITEAPSVRQETVDAVRNEATQRRLLAGDTGKQLETLLLQVFQAEKLPAMAWGSADLAQEAEAVLERARAKLDALAGTRSHSGVARPLPGLGQLHQTLRNAMARAEWAPGAKALQQLADEYTQLESALRRQNAAGPLAMAEIPDLVQETYRQGLGVLAKALELEQTAHSLDRDRRRAEAIDLEREIESLKGDPAAAGRVRVKEEALAGQRAVLERVEQLDFWVEELLHHAGRCEESQVLARLELAVVQAQGLEAGIKLVTDNLARVIQRTRKVQEELKRLGF